MDLIWMNYQCHISSRDLFKYTLMRKKSNMKDLNPRPLKHEAFVLSLCYNSCQRKNNQSEDTEKDQVALILLNGSKLKRDFFEEFRANTCGPN